MNPDPVALNPRPPKFLLAVLAVAVVVIFLTVWRSYTSWIDLRVPPPTPRPTPDYRGAQLPEFPWPPRASAFMNIPSQFITNQSGTTALKDVGLRLEAVLRQGGYGQFGYYSIPRGFALVTRLEQFKADGTPADEPYRWSQEILNPRVFSLEYVRILLQGKTGHYRVIVFAVTDDDLFAQVEGKQVDVERADRLAIEGANKLPDWIGNSPYTDRHWCAALVYEFEKPSVDQPIDFKPNSNLLPQAHLQKILPHLENRR